MHVSCRCAHEAVPGLTNSQDVSGAQQRVEVVLLGGDVRDCDHDVDDRLGGQPWYRCGTDVFDRDVDRGESLRDPLPLLTIYAWPAVVVAMEFQLERLYTSHEFNR